MSRKLLFAVLALGGLSGALAARTDSSKTGARASKADQPPRKVVVGTAIYGPYGDYPGLEARIKVLSGIVDEMAEQAKKIGPSRTLDLAILPEEVVTSLRGNAMERAVPLEGIGLLLAKPVSFHDVDRVRDFVERMDGRNER